MVTTFDPGRMIWNGYTGAAGWMFRQALEGVLGLRLVDGEVVAPADLAAAGELGRGPRRPRRLGEAPCRGPRGPRPARAADRRRTGRRTRPDRTGHPQREDRIRWRSSEPEPAAGGTPSALAPARPWSLALAAHGRRAVAPTRPGPGRTASRFPTVPAEHPHARALLENALRYVAPANKMVDPVSGYPFEGWNQDPKRGSSSGRSPS